MLRSIGGIADTGGIVDIGGIGGIAGIAGIADTGDIVGIAGIGGIECVEYVVCIGWEERNGGSICACLGIEEGRIGGIDGERVI